MKSDKIKLIVALVILVVAVVFIAYRLNLFGGGSSNPPPAPKDPSAPQRGGPRAVPK